MHVRIPMVPVLALQVVGSGCGTTDETSSERTTAEVDGETAGGADDGNRPDRDTLIGIICAGVADCYDAEDGETSCREAFTEYLADAPLACADSEFAWLQCYAAQSCDEYVDPYYGDSSPILSPDCEDTYYAFIVCSVSYRYPEP